MPADPRFIPGPGKFHLRGEEVNLKYPQPNMVQGYYVMAQATLMNDGTVTKSATHTPQRFDFAITKVQMETEVIPLVHPDTDTDGVAGFPQWLLDLWGNAVKAGNIHTGLIGAGVASKIRVMERARLALLDNPPPAPEPAPE